ncbi:MAG: phosphoribosyltransferase, partial [Vicinamibacterales bacterium]
MSSIQPLIGHDELSARVTSLAQEIRADFPNGPVHFVCVLKGAFIFLADLVRSMEGQVSIDFMALSSYAGRTTTSGEVKLVKDLDTGLE